MVFPNKPSTAERPARHLHSYAVFVKNLGPGPQFLGMGLPGMVGIWLFLSLVTGTPFATGAGVAVGFYALALCTALVEMRRSYPHPVLGWCNAVTLFRLMLVSALIGFVVSPAPEIWPVAAVATAAFALDGLDGWLARREGFASIFGAKFDVEVDSVLALVLALHVYLSGNAGAYVILFGLPRYVFAVAQLPMPWLNGDLPPRFSRKVVCVLQIAVLIVLLLPGVDPALSHLLLGVTACALLWSFGRDVRLLWQAPA